VRGKGKYSQELLDLYDGYAHGQISRRQFLDRAAGFTVSGLSAAAVLGALSPDYAYATQVAPDDDRIEADYRAYESPAGAGTMRGLLVFPTTSQGQLPAVLVVHENRGLNPYIEDVARRVAVAGYAAFAPDALTPLGGYPGNDDDGRELQGRLDRQEMLHDFIAAVTFLQGHPQCSGRVACVGFCFGGWVCNQLAVNVPDLSGAAPFYGGQPELDEVPRINAPLLLHHGELDKRVNAGWPAYRDALLENDKAFTEYTYPNANHGFHNETTPRYDEQAAELAWQRTLEFFGSVLV
jgi:carboxymethylenebutenolidase